jgi:basic membrane protein A and related proteins
VTGHVFISYRRESPDAEYVQRLANYLRETGFSVWFDHQIRPGDSWDEAIRERIGSCAVFIVVMSPSAESSQWVRREIDEADLKGKPILPLLLEGDRFFRLADLQYEDVSAGTMPGPAFIARLRGLVDSPTTAGAGTPAAATAGPATAGPATFGSSARPAPAGPAPAALVHVPRQTVRAVASPPASPPGTPRRRGRILITAVAAGVAVTLVFGATFFATHLGGSANAGHTSGETAGNPKTTTPDTTRSATTPVPVPTFKACMITDVSGLNDNSFNAAAWTGLQAARDAPGAHVAIREVESASAADYAPNLTSATSQGCSVIVAVGPLLADAVSRVAAAHPSQQFVLVDGAANLPNVHSVQFDTVQAAFLAGFLAAGYSKTGIVATYGGLKIPPVTIFMDGFVQGVGQYNKTSQARVQVLGWNRSTQAGTFTNTFASPDVGRKISDQLRTAGADVIMPVAGGAGIGTVQDAASGKFTAIWVDVDGCVATAYCSGLLTSVQKNIGTAVHDTIVRLAGSPGMTGGYIGTLANGGVSLAPYHGFESKIPASLKAQVDSLKADISAGRLRVTSVFSPR